MLRIDVPVRNSSIICSFRSMHAFTSAVINDMLKNRVGGKINMKTFRNIIIGVFLGAAIVLGGLYVMQKYHAKPEEEPVQINLSTEIQGRINEIGQLATAEYIYDITQVLEKPPEEVFSIKVPFTGGHTIYSYSGTIKAGIEFSQVQIDVNDETKTVTVTMPEVIQISNEIDNDSLKVYDEQSSFINQFKMEDFNESVESLKKTAEDTASERGLQENALENAKVIITNMLASVIDTQEYKVVFN